MPLFGLAIGYAASLAINSIMHYLGSLLLMAVGIWELIEEIRERLEKRKNSIPTSAGNANLTSPTGSAAQKFSWQRQFLLALSVSLDELAVGFSLGAVTAGRHVSPLVLCFFIGLQGFIMTLLGLVLGRILRTRLRTFKDWSELLSGVLLIGLGVWLLVT